jgi:predicted esterase
MFGRSNLEAAGRPAALAAILLVALAPRGAAPTPGSSPVPQTERRESFRAMLWGDAEQAGIAREGWRAMRAAVGRGEQDPDTRAELFDLEEVLREGPPYDATVAGETAGRLEVALPDGRVLPVFVSTPPGYSTERPWPLIFAMHGGPPGSEEGALRSAVGMVEVWRRAAAAAGWIIASPAMVHVRSMGQRTDDRLPYEILTPEQAEAIVVAVQRRYRVDPDRIVSTGISLGSNFSIAYGASIPHRFASIVPVSTEGDSREHLLRNLQHVPAYVLEGSQDRNIRGINGPRALGEILGRLAYDATYREFPDRAHEGFSELYPDVLRWADKRPRNAYPRDVLRLPHAGIMPLSRRVFWVESDTRQGVVRVRVRDGNHIDIESRWARAVTLYLNDRIVDLDRPVQITVNGEQLPPHRPRRSIEYAIEQVRALGDAGRVATDEVTIVIPGGPSAIAAGAALWDSLAPAHAEGQLSFWEFYAVNALEERFPSVGLEGNEVELDAEMLVALGRLSTAADRSVSVRRADAPAERGQDHEIVGVSVTSVDPESPLAGIAPGDILLEVGGEPFFRGRGGLSGLHRWLARELGGTPKRYPVAVWRNGRGVLETFDLALGDYRPQ